MMLRQYLKKEFFVEKKKNEDEKGGKYLEKENIWRRKIFGEGK